MSQVCGIYYVFVCDRSELTLGHLLQIDIELAALLNALSFDAPISVRG